MNSYPFIVDPKAVVAFGDSVLKRLQEDETYLVFLAARRKYLTPEQSHLHLTGADMIARTMIKNKKGVTATPGEMLLRACQKLCLPEGHYVCGGGEPIPMNAFTMFVTINPRDMRKAALEFSLETVKLLADDSAGFENIETRLYSAIHSNCSRKMYLDLDVDYKGVLSAEDKINAVGLVKNALGKTPTKHVLTKNGLHVLIERDMIDPAVKATFYKELQYINTSLLSKRPGLEFEVEIKNDSMTPIPGCTQGGFVPVLREWEV